MPTVKNGARYVAVAYELLCGFERATALAKDVYDQLKKDAGFFSAEDDTRGWDGDKMAVVVVTYRTLLDAVRLDALVRKLLSRKVAFTYEPHVNTCYGRTGASSYVTATTSITASE